MSEGTLSPDTLEVVLERQEEIHSVSSYEVVDRPFEADTLLGMLDQGIAFQRTLELIVSQVVPILRIPSALKRRPELALPPKAEKALQQVVVS